MRRSDVKWALVSFYEILKDRCKTAAKSTRDRDIIKGVYIGDFVLSVKMDSDAWAFIPKIAYVGNVDPRDLEDHIYDFTDSELSTAYTKFVNLVGDADTTDLMRELKDGLNSLVDFAFIFWRDEREKLERDNKPFNPDRYDLDKRFEKFDGYMMHTYGHFSVGSHDIGVIMHVRLVMRTGRLIYSADTDLTVSREVKGDNEFDM